MNYFTKRYGGLAVTNQAESAQIVRSVKTLLLCKVEIGSESNIKELYTGNTKYADGDKIDQYFALGDFDAFSIYDTCVQPSDKDWLAEVYYDRLNISKKAGRLYSYNPIHLVSTKEKQQDVAKNYCAATIIYGWKDESKLIEDSITAAIQSIKENSTQGQESELEFSVYQAVNICDAVILWRSDSYNSLCRMTMSLLKGGFARKTYTIIGARYTVKDDNIEFCCSNSEEASDVQIRGSIREIKGARTWLRELHEDIKEDHSGAVMPLHHPFKVLSGGFDFVEDYQNLYISKLLSHLMKTNKTYGSNTEPSFWDMRTDLIMVKPNESLVGADPPEIAEDAGSGEKKEPKKTITDALNVLYDRFIETYHDKLLSDKTNSKTEDWPYSYGELLGVTASIDQNPALRTPAYLMFDYLRVCDIVFRHFIERTEGYDQVLSDSLERLKKAIHLWNQLIDQTIRTDELVIKGIGFASSIYNSVPVQLVDFYNSLINNFLRTLLSCAGQDPPAYAFLLLLNQSYQIRITSLFSDENLRRNMVEKYCTKACEFKNCNACREFKNCNACETKRNCWRQKCWPPEQVYLVELPTDVLYKPTELIVSLAHEVFHIFGDQFRDREYRWRLFGQAMIQIFLRKLHIADNTEAYVTMAKKLKEYLRIGDGGFTINSPNLRETKEYFANKLSQFLGLSLKDAFREANGKDWEYYLSTKVFDEAWQTLKNDFLINFQQQKDVGIVQEFTQLEYFLKECFADICAIRAFNIDLSEYYSALNRGIPPASRFDGLHRMLQRAMITTVSCIRSHGLTQNASGSSILSEDGKKMFSSFYEWAGGICKRFSSILNDTRTFSLIMKRFQNLLAMNCEDEILDRLLFGGNAKHVQAVVKWACLQYEIDPEDKNALEQLRTRIDNKEPPIETRTRRDIGAELTLSYFMESDLEAIVLEYLSSVNRKWDDALTEKKYAPLLDYSSKFNNLIRNSQFFTKGFMDEIKKYHETIDNIACGMSV